MTTHSPASRRRAFSPSRAIAHVLGVLEVLAEQTRRMFLAELSTPLQASVYFKHCFGPDRRQGLHKQLLNL